MRPRELLRGAVLDGLSTFSRMVGSEHRALERPRVQHIFLHHVFGDEEDGFRRLLDSLAGQHSFIGYSESLQRIWNGDFDKPYIAFSFDDGLKSCLRAATVLEEFGASACYFVVGSMVGETDHGRIEQFCRERLAMPPTEFLDWDDLEQLKSRGHEIGSHGMNHVRLRALDADGLATELEGSHTLLSDRLGAVDHFAWPFGHFDDAFPEVVDRARRAGFLSCAANERGAHVATAAPDTLCLRRDHVLANWPARQVLWFLARNSRRASPATNQFPR